MHTPPLSLRPRPSDIEWLLLLLACAWVGLFYLRHAQAGWFFQDDFGFLQDYAAALRWHQLWDGSGFGRFLSRNVYWHGAQRAFGEASALYFTLNLMILLANAWLVRQILGRELPAIGAWTGAYVYAGMAGVVHAYAWLSNSQHLLAHLFVLAFVACYLARDLHAPPHPARALVLLALYLAGLSTNAFAGLVLSLPVLAMARHATLRRDLAHAGLVLLGGLAFLGLWWVLRDQQTGAYRLALTWATLAENARFHVGSAWLAGAGAVACLAGATQGWRRGDLVLSWLCVAALLFALPYAFLAQQRHPPYLVPTLLFASMATLIVLHRATPRRAWHRLGRMALLGLVIWTALPSVAYHTRHPWGADQRALVGQLRDVHAARAGPARYCFVAASEPGSDGKGPQGIPREWWFVGFGRAFSRFVDPASTYVLQPRPEGCDLRFILDEARLRPLPVPEAAPHRR